MRLVLPRLYVILDAALTKLPERNCALSLADAGVRLLQYRNKTAPARQLLDSSRELAHALIPRGVTVFVNDRPDAAYLSGASGVHVGQEDLDVEGARLVMGRERLIGVSTHNFEQFERAGKSSADYIAIGPIFPTSSKANPDPVVGLDFVRRVRSLTEKPIVAIGGITVECAAEVIEAGADSIAVMSGIIAAGDPARRAEQYIQVLKSAKHAAAV